MAFTIKTCVVCGEDFDLKPDKPGFANRCPTCTHDETEANAAAETRARMDSDERKAAAEANEGRRKAMRDLLYRKDS